MYHFAFWATLLPLHLRRTPHAFPHLRARLPFVRHSNLVFVQIHVPTCAAPFARPRCATRGYRTAHAHHTPFLLLAHTHRPHYARTAATARRTIRLHRTRLLPPRTRTTPSRTTSAFLRALHFTTFTPCAPFSARCLPTHLRLFTHAHITHTPLRAVTRPRGLPTHLPVPSPLPFRCRTRVLRIIACAFARFTRTLPAFGAPAVLLSTPRRYTSLPSPTIFPTYRLLHAATHVYFCTICGCVPFLPGSPATAAHVHRLYPRAHTAPPVACTARRRVGLRVRAALFARTRCATRIRAWL